jgi:hypothetical protein
MEPGHPAAHCAMRNTHENLLELSDIITPKKVFVTGPHACYNGHHSFPYGDKTQLREVIPNPPILNDSTIHEFVGMQGNV